MNPSLVMEETYGHKTSRDQNKLQQLEPPISSSSFSDFVTRLVMGHSASKSSSSPSTASTPSASNGTEFDNDIVNNNTSHKKLIELDSSPSSSSTSTPSQTQTAASTQQNSWPTSVITKPRSCRAPVSKKFAHPCNCGFNNHHRAPPHPQPINNNNLSLGYLPTAALTNPMHLYDPISKKCLPTSRQRDMLLKDCHTHVINIFPMRIHHGNSSPCVYDDLVCDSRRFRCICKPSLHLYYESNLSSFGCVPIGSASSPDGRTGCKSGHIYNVITKDCHKIFDVNDLPPNYTTGVSATQFSFVTIVLIWILLLILIVTAKLRKLRTSSFYRNSPTSTRRTHHHRTGGGTGRSAYRSSTQGHSAWLHPFIAAVNGHHHMNHHRNGIDRRTRSMTIDDTSNYNDTDFFLTNGNLRINEMLDGNNFAGSQQSINNPPPKFEEIYPSRPDEQQPQPQPQQQPCSDLPSYDEAMKLKNTIPPDLNKE